MRPVPATLSAPRFAFAAAMLWLLAAHDPAAAQEWTRFRGPNGQGQSDANFPAELTDNLVRWKASLPGAGHSSPVLWGDKIFLTSADPDAGHRWLLCLSAADGRILWQRDFPFHSFHVHTQNGYATSTPTVDKRLVYSAWATPEEFFIVAHDHDGQEVWRTGLGRFESEHGYGASPVLYRDLLIVTNDQDGDSSLEALRAADGTVAWRVPHRTREKQSTSYAAPCVYRPAGGADQLIVESWAYGMSGIDPRSGATLWELPVFPKRPVSSPALADGLILGTCGEGSGVGNTLIALKPPDGPSAAPEVVYKLDKTVSPYVPSVLMVGDMAVLWADKGIVSCMDAASGNFYWKSQRVGGNFSGSPVRAGDKIFAISSDGEVVALAASKQFKVLGRTPLGEASRATPAIVGNRMYLRTASRLICVESDQKSAR